MNKSLKYTLIGVAVLIVVFIVLKKTGVIGGKAGLKVAIEKVQYRSITEIVSASGKVQPEVEVKISSDVSGEITALFVKEGQTVKRGDILCKIDPMIYESNRDKMLAMLNSLTSVRVLAGTVYSVVTPVVMAAWPSFVGVITSKAM
jgi:HlyD family secretion protein